MGNKRRAGYPSDVSDEEWGFVAPYLALCREDALQREHSLRAVFTVFGSHQSVQRCRAHKLRNAGAPTDGFLAVGWNVLDYLPKDDKAQVKSLLEGLEECFTIRLDPPPALHRCLATTNIIESPHAGVRIQTRRVTHWQNGKMVLRWMASAFLRTEKRFKRIMGHRDLWALDATLNPSATASQKAA